MKAPEQEALQIGFEEIAEGSEREARYQVTREVLSAMTETFGDRNPLHTEEEYARSQGFSGPVMHGAALHGFLSHFVGMIFPGRDALLLSVQIRYLAPSHLGNELVLKAKVSQKAISEKVIVLNFTFHNTTLNHIAGRGQAHVRVR